MKHILVLLLMLCWWTFVVDRKTEMPPGDYITDYQGITASLKECEELRHKTLTQYRKHASIHDSTGWFSVPEWRRARYVAGPCLPGGVDKPRDWYRWGPPNWLPGKDK